MKRFLDFLIEASLSVDDARKVLGLGTSFTDDDLKAAYKKAALANHPDKGGDVATMQKINVARDILAKAPHTATHTTTHNQHDDDENSDGPVPQSRDISKEAVYAMFQRELRAEIRTLGSFGSPVIRIPLKMLDENGNPVVLVLNRWVHNLGVEYLAKGLFKQVPKQRGKLKPLEKFYDESNTVWESAASIVWLIKQLTPIVKADKVSLSKIAKVFQEYKRVATKIDSNIR